MMTDHPDFLFTKYIEKAAFDTRTSVEDKDYQVPFSFNGNIAKLEVALQP